MNQNIENVVESLTNLVNDVKGVLRSFAEGTLTKKLVRFYCYIVVL